MSRPVLSVVIAVHDMPAQASRTIRSLSAPYQRDLGPEPVEVIVIENNSDHCLDEPSLEALAANVRYVRREERGQSPAAAMNVGLGMATGEFVAVMVDGARMLSPGVISRTIAARCAAKLPVIAVPGYHLGFEHQAQAAAAGYDDEAESALLSSIAWPADGYRLFDVAVPSGSCAYGFLAPMSESNFLAAPRSLFEELGGYDERFETPGGGFVNLDLYRRAIGRTGTTLVILAGEGTFHQFHHGATTGSPHFDRAMLLRDMAAEYRRIRGTEFEPPRARPLLFGDIHFSAARHLEYSARVAASQTDA